MHLDADSFEELTRHRASKSEAMSKPFCFWRAMPGSATPEHALFWKYLSGQDLKYAPDTALLK
jgi:hypothetical protein